jgi:protocatechuate 3,4-dioxygenase beta subunit
VTLRQGEKEIKTVTTDKNGDFSFANLKPGVYGLTCRKAGLSTASLEDITLRAGDKIQLKDKITLDVNEGELALIRVSVFTAGGRSVAGVKVELMRVNSDGSLKKIDESVTGLYGQVAFRRTPDTAQYRAIAKTANNPASDIINVEGAAIYRTAIQLPPQ